MKYIKLFEGFESDALSNVLSYITKKLDKSQSKDFLNLIKRICDANDIPASSLNNNEIEYMSAKKALKMESNEEVLNPTEIYCLKFLFNLEKGYVGTLGVGNKRMNFEDINNVKNLNKDKFEKLDNAGYKGKIKSVKFEELKSGDKVFVCLANSFNVDRFVDGEIYKDDRDPSSIMWYVMQNKSSDGSSLYQTKNGENINSKYDINNPDCEYSYYYRLGYNSEGEGFEEDNDHCYLYSYKENDVLKIDGEEDFNNKSLWDYNFKYTTSSNHLKFWNNSNDVEDYKKADFAIVLYLDDALTRLLNGDAKSDIMADRKKSKEGATALLTNDVIKNQNIDKYFKVLYDRLDIKADKKIFGNLNTYISNTIGDKYFCLVSFEQNPLRRLDDLSYSINTLMVASKDNPAYSDETVQYYYNDLSKKYINHKKNADRDISLIKQNIKLIKNFNNDKINKITDKLISIGEFISKSIKSSEYKTLNELRFISHTLISIKDMLKDYASSIQIEELYSSIVYSEPQSLLRRLKDIEEDYTDEQFEEDMDKLDDLEKYIKKLF